MPTCVMLSAGVNIKRHWGQSDLRAFCIFALLYTTPQDTMGMVHASNDGGSHIDEG